MTILHKGFDTLAIAIQANIPLDFFEYLEVEKERADKERHDVLTEFNGVKLHLKSHGGKGYRFIANGGPDGAHWFFKKPNAKDKWGIRVSFGSYFLAHYGLAAARLHLEQVLGQLGVRFGEEDVSISRVDFCIDVLAPDFKLIPERFVMHSSTGRRDFIEEMTKVVHGKSGRTTSVTIGSTRNRQVIIYDKRAEIIHTGKAYWWGIWNHTLRGLGLPLLAPDNPEISRVWRVEFRAGKDLLKDRWGIRTWTQLHDLFGDLCCEAGEVVRYTDPNPNDPNRARWPNHLLWELVCAEMNDELCEMRSGCDPNPMKEVHKENHISMMIRQIRGNIITLAALNGKSQEELPKFLQETANDLSHEVIQNPEKTRKQLQSAKDRYVFIQPKKHAHG
ncbi:MAG: hypothetical protein JKX71_12795 [Amylibacter sp.]|nr:hypothetical protein [Amylibacter sp.]